MGGNLNNVAASLKTRTISALFWSAWERVGQQGVQFLVAVILARLLFPSDFGLVSMLAIFMAVAQAFIDSGFGQAIIQKQDSDHIDECSIFYFNIVLGFTAAGILCISAPLIASFYDRPLLVPLTRVLSLNMIINSFGTLQTALLTKRIDFKTQLKVSLMAAIISGIVAIGGALYGLAVWSLVLQSLTSNFVRTVSLWFFNDWRPSWLFSFTSLRKLFGFGSKLLMSGLSDTIFQNIYLVVIGKVFSPADLGYYYQAKQTQQLPVNNLFGIVGRVTFPVFSSLQDDKMRLKQGVKKSLQALAWANFPLMVGLLVTAKPLTILLLTAKWAPSIPYLQLLCLVGMFYPLHAINLNVLTALGRSDLLLKLEFLKKAITVLAIAITYRWGIQSMIIGQIGTTCIGYYINSYYTGKFLGYAFWEQLIDLYPCAIAASLMGIGVYSLELISALSTSPSLLLLAQVPAGAALYLAFSYLFRLPSLRELKAILRNKTLATST